MPDPGTILVQRLHRLVRAGYIPLLGHPDASPEARSITLHRRGHTLTLHPDGSLALPGRTLPATGPDFDALFPPGRPNRRNLVRRLYEMGLGS